MEFGDSLQLFFEKTWLLFFIGWWVYFIILHNKRQRATLGKYLVTPAFISGLSLLLSFGATSGVSECNEDIVDGCLDAYRVAQLDQNGTFVGFLHDWFIGFGMTVADLQLRGVVPLIGIMVFVALTRKRSVALTHN